MPYPEEIQNRINQYIGDDPASTRDEIALCKMLIADAVTQNRPALANSLLGTLSKLSSVHISNETRRGALLDRTAVIALSRDMLSAITARLSNVPNSADIMGVLADDFTRIFERRKPLTIEAKYEQERE